MCLSTLRGEVWGNGCQWLRRWTTPWPSRLLQAHSEEHTGVQGWEVMEKLVAALDWSSSRFEGTKEAALPWTRVRLGE